jgi:hypothetical protein
MENGIPVNQDRHNVGDNQGTFCGFGNTQVQKTSGLLTKYTSQMQRSG